MPTTPPTADSLPALERFLTYRMHVVNKVSDRDSNRAYQDTCGLPLGEARCLAAIGRYAPLSVNDLARAANLNKGQASRSAQALVERGLVTKQACENDARGVLLAPTGAGQVRYTQIVALIARRNDEIFGCLSKQEQAQLGDLLDRVIAHMAGHDPD
ncbi:MAG TPA: MarR family winged helix-turn-helix transcriptional regulator [Bordetella sp.]|nr:MarR family winged helix-turn-helix transcriptional regulator [Bordetella sp.]